MVKLHLCAFAVCAGNISRAHADHLACAGNMQAAQPAKIYRRGYMKYKLIRLSHSEIVRPILGRHFITKMNTINKYSTKHLLLRNDLCCLHDSFIISNLCYDKVFSTTIRHGKHFNMSTSVVIRDKSVCDYLVKRPLLDS